MDRYLENIDFRVRILMNFRQAGNFVSTFLKWNLILQPITLLVGIFVVKLGALLISNVAGLAIPQSHIRFYQIGAVIVGGMASFLFAVFRGLGKMNLK